MKGESGSLDEVEIMDKHFLSLNYFSSLDYIVVFNGRNQG